MKNFRRKSSTTSRFSLNYLTRQNCSHRMRTCSPTINKYYSSSSSSSSFHIKIDFLFLLRNALFSIWCCFDENVTERLPASTRNLWYNKICEKWNMRGILFLHIVKTLIELRVAIRDRRYFRSCNKFLFQTEAMNQTAALSKPFSLSRQGHFSNLHNRFSREPLMTLRK